MKKNKINYIWTQPETQQKQIVRINGLKITIEQEPTNTIEFTTDYYAKNKSKKTQKKRGKNTRKKR